MNTTTKNLQKNHSALNNKTITFIGGGNMARALITGLIRLKKQASITLNIGVSEPNTDSHSEYQALGVTAVSPENAGALIAGSDVLVLAVKPQVLGDVVANLRPHISNQLIISIAAGVGLASLSAMTGSERVVRTMPNLPAMVGQGATGLYAHASISSDDRALADALMGASGLAVWVSDEDQLHTVTAVAGSAPAYFFYVLEQMIDKAAAMGLPRADAHKLAVQTMHGAAIMAADEEPQALRAKVTSKGGTTHAAITYMQDHQVGEHIQGALLACSERSRELGQ